MINIRYCILIGPFTDELRGQFINAVLASAAKYDIEAEYCKTTELSIKERGPIACIDITDGKRFYRQPFDEFNLRFIGEDMQDYFNIIIKAGLRSLLSGGYADITDVPFDE